MSSSRRAGQIVKRGERRWLVRVYRGTDAAGRRRYRNATVNGTKRDAQERLNEMLRDGEAGVEPSTLSLSAYLDRWLAESVAPRVRPRTLQDYRRFLDAYVRPELGDRRLARLTTLDLQSLYTKIGEEASAHAVVHTHRPLSAALRQAVAWKMLRRNPAEGVKVPREPRRGMCVLSPDEVVRFQTEAAKHPRGFIFTFSIVTGFRPGEVQGLAWSDCDLRAGTIAVRRSVAWLEAGRWEFGDPKTPQSRRTIPLPSSVAEALRRHRRDQLAFRSRQLERGRVGANHDLVFPSRTGEPLYGPNLSKRVLKPILAAAELDMRFRWYDCRHTCATLLLAAGENPKVVSERLGHATVAFTLDRYAHVLPGMQEGASERLEDLLFGA